jgi:hypothetical protein
LLYSGRKHFWWVKAVAIVGVARRLIGWFGTSGLTILVAVLAFSPLFARADAASFQNTLMVMTAVDMDRVTKGDVQTIYVAVLGADGKPLPHATVSALVFFGKNFERWLTGTTGSDGVWSFSWTVEKHSRSGLEGVDIKVDNPGYDTEYASLVFRYRA